MKNGCLPEKKSTKELILEAAFSFYIKPYIRDFSMSELAAKVGLSKPAIYRHFKSKAELQNEMRSRFFYLIAQVLKEAQENSGKSSGKSSGGKIYLESLIEFLAENIQYINYFICEVTVEHDFFDLMDKNLALCGVMKKMEDIIDLKDEVYSRARSSFVGISILFFIKARRDAAARNENVAGVKQFASSIVEFLGKGLRGFSKKGEAAWPSEISENRILELERLCSIKNLGLPEESKIFKAIASVIRKFSTSGVTVEGIAGELGMAKSSLYFYFENKNQMIFSLVKKEVSLLFTICQENMAEARNFSELVYINLMTEINFFLERSSMLSICGWLLQTSNENEFVHNDDEEFEQNSKWSKALKEVVPRLGFGFDIEPDILRFWVGSLPVAATVLKFYANFNDEQIVQTVKYLFGFVENGVWEENR